MTSPIRGLLVDIDGVVRIWHRRTADQAAAAYGLPPRSVRETAYGGDIDLAHVGVLTHEQWVDGVRRRLEAQYGSDGAAAADLWAADRGDADPRMVDLLRRARRAGLVIAALSNNTSSLRADLRLLHLEELFDHVVNSADIGLTKPSPAAYTRALEMMGLSADAVAFCDDHLVNAVAATHVGLHAHHYQDAATFEEFLRGLGQSLRPTRPARPVSPPSGHAESDTHTCVRYLPDDALLPVTGQEALAPLGSNGVATTDADGTVTTWRLLPPHVDGRHQAGYLDAWLPGAAAEHAVEYLPPWEPETRRTAVPHAQRLLYQTAWALHHVCARHQGGDVIGAAHCVDQARNSLTELATLLGRRQPVPWPGSVAARYLPDHVIRALTESWAADLTTPVGLATALTPLIGLTRALRHSAGLVLDADVPWPWDHMAKVLAPLLGEVPQLTPLHVHDSLYNHALATVFDKHRPVVAEMADGLRGFARDSLIGLDVLELGAGTGRITQFLAEGPRSYTALEPSDAMLARLRERRLPGVRILRGDAAATPLPDGCVDVVIEHEVLLFTPDPLLACQEAIRLLRPDGRLIRLLLHPDHPDPLDRIRDAYLSAAYSGKPRPLIYGKGTDPRITASLHAQGLPTSVTVIAAYTVLRTSAQVFAALQDRAWPWQHQTDDASHTAGLTAARQIMPDLPAQVPVAYTLRALVTQITKEPRQFTKESRQ